MVCATSKGSDQPAPTHSLIKAVFLFDSLRLINNLSGLPGLDQYYAWINVHAQGHNAVTPVRLEPAAPRSRVKHSTTEPLRSLVRAVANRLNIL